MPLVINTLKTIKVGYKVPMQPIVSKYPSSTWLRCNIRDGATCTTRRRASASLQARLRNPSQTCFRVKQSARS
jgi:hypothetical protein